MLIASALVVISARDPVRAVLFLVLAFFCSSVLWMLLQAEFLSLVLIFVYVGAVMTLFLFVVMMINVDLTRIKKRAVRYLPLGISVVVVLIVTIMFVITPQHLQQASALLPTAETASDYSNVKQIGGLLYTHYAYPFEIASLILLVAIISAIGLAFHGRRPDNKSQKVSEQIKASKQGRVRLINMEKD